MKPSRLTRTCIAVLFALGVGAPIIAQAERYFVIKVVDAATGRGVPLVELRTVNDASWWTDSNGLIAFDEPGLLDTEVFFQINSPGYEYSADMFGFRGVKLKPSRGSEATIKLARLNIAERLYRITGQGIYRDSLMAGKPVPIHEPVLNGQVMGQDTVIATPYNGKLYWFWGDTNRPSHPLGHFGVSGATSELPNRGGLDPGVGIDLRYFVDSSGFSRQMCPTPPYGMRWLEGPFVVKDNAGRERLAARLAVMKDLGAAHEWHLVVFNDERQIFESVQRWDLHAHHESSHPFRARVDGTEYYYLFPEYRVKADLTSMANVGAYAAFTCIAGDGRWQGDDTLLDRDPSGRVRYTWKPGAERLTAQRLRELIRAGKLRAEESSLQLTDFDSGTALTCGLASVAWNECRQRWIGFFAHRAGEAWWAEADTPVGPWVYGRRVATHGEYNFYNIAHHPFFDQREGSVVYFEGTYTDSFSGARARTPRYNYNQIMYRLDLADERLQLPVAIYRVRASHGAAQLKSRDQIAGERAWPRTEEIAFFALPAQCRRAGTIPVFVRERDDTAELSFTPPSAGAVPRFVALPPAAESSSPGLEGLWTGRIKNDGDSADGLELTLNLKREGERVTATWQNGTAAGSGTFRDNRLDLRLQVEADAFRAEATVANDRLDGTWQQIDSPAKGTWFAKWVDPAPPEWKSPRIVGLRRFRRTATGEHFYSVATPPPDGCEADGPVLCRVWQAPSTLPVLDWQAEPIVPASRSR